MQQSKRTAQTAVILTAWAVLISCASVYPLEKPHVVTLDRIEINVVPSPAYFPEISFFHGAAPFWTKGLATRENQIFVIGHFTPTGRIAVNPEILGHELQHLMNYKDGVFINPDLEGH